MSSQLENQSIFDINNPPPPPVLKRQLPISGAKWFCLVCNQGLSNYSCTCDKCGYDPLKDIKKEKNKRIEERNKRLKEEYEKKKNLEKEIQKVVNDIISKL